MVKKSLQMCLDILTHYWHVTGRQTDILQLYSPRCA